MTTPQQGPDDLEKIVLRAITYGANLASRFPGIEPDEQILNVLCDQVRFAVSREHPMLVVDSKDNEVKLAESEVIKARIDELDRATIGSPQYFMGRKETLKKRLDRLTKALTSQN